MRLELEQQDIDEALSDEELANKLRRKLLNLKMRHPGALLGMIAKTLKGIVTLFSVLSTARRRRSSPSQTHDGAWYKSSPRRESKSESKPRRASIVVLGWEKLRMIYDECAMLANCRIVSRLHVDRFR
jgi:hypothetical protein